MKVDILLPTKGRPDSLKAALESIYATVTNFAHVRVLVGIDKCDKIEIGPQPPLSPAIKVCELSGEADALGELQNELAKQSDAGFIALFADDMRMLSRGWDNELFERAKYIPDGICLFAFNDPDHDGFPAYPIVTRRWLDGLGYLVPPYFPFWWGDTWLDEIATMIGRYVPLQARVVSQGERGKTRNCRDIEFWARFFDETRPLREKDADRLMRLIRGEQRKFFIARNARLRDPALIANFASLYGDSAEPDERYLRSKERASQMMGLRCEVLNAAD